MLHLNKQHSSRESIFSINSDYTDSKLTRKDAERQELQAAKELPNHERPLGNTERKDLTISRVQTLPQRPAAGARRRHEDLQDQEFAVQKQQLTEEGEFRGLPQRRRAQVADVQ